MEIKLTNESKFTSLTSKKKQSFPYHGEKLGQRKGGLKGMDKIETMMGITSPFIFLPNRT